MFTTNECRLTYGRTSGNGLAVFVQWRLKPQLLLDRGVQFDFANRAASKVFVVFDSIRSGLLGQLAAGMVLCLEAYACTPVDVVIREKFV